MVINKITEKSSKKYGLIVSNYLEEELSNYIKKLRTTLYLKMDVRLVNTFEELLKCIIRHRHNANGLIITELGGKLLGSDKSPAGSKRIGKLLTKMH